MQHPLFQWEGGADHDVLHGWLVGACGSRGVPVPRDHGLVNLVDIQDVGLELALLQPGVGCIHAHPVPVAQAVRGCLSLRVPGRGGNVTMRGIMLNYVYTEHQTPPLHSKRV